jgi:IS30 family transposase
MKLKLYQMLLKKRRFRYPRIKRRRQTIANSRKRPIKERDAAVNTRNASGHWEGDLILFSHTKTNLLLYAKEKVV